VTGAPLDADCADRLCKLLGLCGSSHAGERAAAGLKASELLKSHNLTWRQVIAAPAMVPAAPEPPRRTEPDWRTMTMFCFARREQLCERDRTFVEGMFSQQGAPSERQRSWLLDVVARLHGDD
jgi:hypothetical protein